MNTRIILSDLHRNAFGPEYENALVNAYAEDVACGTFATEEGDYNDAVTYLEKHFSQEQKETLRKIETDYRDNRCYASKYPFFCGLMCAFEQFFVPDRKQDYDYTSTVQERMCTMPSMMRHREYYSTNRQILERVDTLMETVDKETREHIVSICCAWDQRIHSQTINAFYLGYRAGLEIMEQVQPMSSYKLTSKKLYLEYELGFTTPYEQRERKPAKKEVS